MFERQRTPNLADAIGGHVETHDGRRQGTDMEGARGMHISLEVLAAATTDRDPPLLKLPRFILRCLDSHNAW